MEKRFNFFLSAEMHKEIKLKATLDGKTMNDFILNAVKKELAKKEVKSEGR